MQYKILSSDTAELKFYGEISRWWISAKDYTNTLEELENKGIKTLNIRVHCYGGEVYEGNTMWSANRRSKMKIDFYVDGVAASMMAILIHSGRNVYMHKFAKVMIHQPSSGVYGTYKQMFAQGKMLKSITNDFIGILKAKTKKSQQEVEGMLDGQDNWYDAQECVAMGMATGIFDEGEFTTEVVAKPDPGVKPEVIFAQYTALAQSNQNHNPDMNKKELIEKFNLQGVTADSSDSDIYAAIAKKMEANDQRVADLQAQNDAALTTQANAEILIRESQLQTKFTEQEKAAYLTVAKSGGIETLKLVLASAKSAPNISTLISTTKQQNGDLLPADRQSWTFAMWEEKDPAGLEKLESANPEAFKKLYNEQFPGNSAKFY